MKTKLSIEEHDKLILEMLKLKLKETHTLEDKTRIQKIQQLLDNN